jgi:hypothetical protein
MQIGGIKAFVFGGSCKYGLKEGSGLCNDWLCEHVVLNIS